MIQKNEDHKRMRLWYYRLAQTVFLMPCVISHCVRHLFFSLIHPPFDPGKQIAAFQERFAAATLRPELPGFDGSVESGWAGDLVRGFGVTDFGVGVKNVWIQRALFFHDLNHAPSCDFSLQRAWLHRCSCHKMQMSFLRHKAALS
ncbi:MAG: hypothetical protein ACREEM_11130 [Blastocatellia bacterium]